MSAVNIRKATYEDLPAIAKLEAEIYTYEGPWSLADYQEDFALPDRYYLVAEDAGKIVGYASASIENKIGHLIGNTVIPEYRGQGIGKQFLKTRLSWLFDKCSKVIAEIRPDNSVSQKLLEENGFAFHKVLSDYYGEGKDGHEFIKEIQ